MKDSITLVTLIDKLKSRDYSNLNKVIESGNIFDTLYSNPSIARKEFKKILKDTNFNFKNVDFESNSVICYEILLNIIYNIIRITKRGKCIYNEYRLVPEDDLNKFTKNYISNRYDSSGKYKFILEDSSLLFTYNPDNFVVISNFFTDYFFSHERFFRYYYNVEHVFKDSIKLQGEERPLKYYHDMFRRWIESVSNNMEHDNLNAWRELSTFNQAYHNLEKVIRWELKPFKMDIFKLITDVVSYMSTFDINPITENGFVFMMSMISNTIIELFDVRLEDIKIDPIKDTLGYLNTHFISRNKFNDILNKLKEEPENYNFTIDNMYSIDVSSADDLKESIILLFDVRSTEPISKLKFVSNIDNTIFNSNRNIDHWKTIDLKNMSHNKAISAHQKTKIELENKVFNLEKSLKNRNDMYEQLEKEYNKRYTNLKYHKRESNIYYEALKEINNLRLNTSILFIKTKIKKIIEKAKEAVKGLDDQK